MRTSGAARVVSAALLVLCAAGARMASAQGGAPPAAPPPPAPPLSLYQRLGGYDSLAVLVDDYVARLTRDPALSRLFAGAAPESKGRMRQLMLDQLCAMSGGPCVYPGRDMKSAHRGLGIGEAEWTATVGHLIASLNLREVGPKEKDEILRFVGGLKKHIVEKS